MRVLILGSSHTVCFREAIAELRTDFPDLEMTTFGLPGGKFAAPDLTGRSYTPRTTPVMWRWNGTV